MLSFLNALCTALLARDAQEVRRLLERPPGRQLPGAVAAEIRAWLDAPGVAAPVHTLHHYHLARQLVLSDVISPNPDGQLELTLGPLEHRFGGSLAIARAARLTDPAAARVS